MPPRAHCRPAWCTRRQYTGGTGPPRTDHHEASRTGLRQIPIPAGANRRRGYEVQREVHRCEAGKGPDSAPTSAPDEDHLAVFDPFLRIILKEVSRLLSVPVSTLMRERSS